MNRMVIVIIGTILLLHFAVIEAQQKVEEGSVEKQIQEVVKLFQTKYYRALTNQEILEGITQGFAKALDDLYVVYYSPKDYATLKQELSAKYKGIGVMLEQDQEKAFKVLALLSGSPAEKAGLKPGDVIVEVNGDANIQKGTLEDLVHLLRGPEGSKVTVTIQRATTRERLKVEIIREEFTYHGLVYKVLENSIGYIECRHFNKGFAEELRRTLEILQQQNIKGLVLDLRKCVGGLMDEVLGIVKIFLGSGVVFKLKSRDHVADRKVEGTASFTKPMIVMIGKETASSAELLTGALKQRERTVLVGQNTYGKGSIQELFELSGGGAVKLTTAYYLTPRGEPVEKNGIKPNVEVVDHAEQLKMAMSLVKILIEK